MRIANLLTFGAPLSLILATGCTYEQRHSSYSTTPSGSVISSRAAADRALADLVRQQFNRYGNLAANAPNVQVSAHDGTVTLTGVVPSEQERRMIDAMVANTPGVV